MRILYIGMDISQYADRSLEIKVADVLAEKHEVTLCCERQPKYRKDEKCRFRRTLVLPVNNPSEITEEQWNTIKIDEYDVIFTSSASGSIIVAILKDRLNIPAVVQILDIPSWRLDGAHPFRDEWRQQWGTWLSYARHADRIILSHSIARMHLLNLTNYPVASTSIIYYGIDDRLAGKVPDQKEEYSISFVSRLVAYKGVEYLVRAAARIEDCPTLKIIGLGHELEPLKKMCEVFGVNAEFLGGVDDYQKFEQLKKSMFMVYPSISLDIGGLAPLEAGVCGKPSIVFDQDVNKEIYQNAVIYARYKDVDSLVYNIDHLIKSTNIRKLMGGLAQEFVNEERTFIVQAQNLTKVLEEVVKK